MSQEEASPTGTTVEKLPDVEAGAPESTAPAKPPAPIEPPDGGTAAWLAILGVSLVSFATFGTVNGYGAFDDYYQSTYLSNYSPTLVSMIGAIQVFLLYVFASVSGAVFDALGPRLMIPLSGFVASFALFMLSITQAQHIYQQYLTHAVLYALGATFAFFPSIAVCAHWFKRKIAFALSFPIAAAGLGGIIFPAILNQLLPRIGWGWSVRVIAFVVLFCFIIGSLTITTPRPPKPLPRLSQLLAFRAFRDPVFVCLCLGGWCGIISVFNPIFYVGLYGEVASGGPTSLTQYYLAILCATSIVGRIGPGFIADRVGRYNVMVVTNLIAGILILALWYTSTAQPNLIAFSALYGFFSGPFFALMSPCIVAISPISEIGARIGMAFAFMSTAALAGTPIGGVFIRKTTVGNFRHLILFSGVFALAGTAFFAAARLLRSRKLWVAV
uniref:Monocarboxylate permease-like protein n=1 Tax=Mycena chlorophos TaxID=658473 RepID=A0ABQ0LCG6_MYCCL|nr:monocarboxylate permease-like protein [Mycena chlorophos]